MLSPFFTVSFTTRNLPDQNDPSVPTFRDRRSHRPLPCRRDRIGTDRTSSPPQCGLPPRPLLEWGYVSGGTRGNQVDPSDFSSLVRDFYPNPMNRPQNPRPTDHGPSILTPEEYRCGGTDTTPPESRVTRVDMWTIQPTVSDSLQLLLGPWFRRVYVPSLGGVPTV